MKRITENMLQARIDYLNKLTGSPMNYSSNKPTEPFKANIGHFTRSGAYGGVSLHRIVNTGGGVEDVFSCGHVTKRDLFNRINAMIIGINTEDTK